MNITRLAWADIGRGIAIFLVVFGHSAIPEIFKAVIYAFHMHLFFFLSGLFFSPNHSFVDFFLKKMRTLMLPYLLYGLLDYAVWIFKVIFVHGQGDSVDLIQPLENLLMLGQFWFLPVLFLVSVLFYNIYMWITLPLFPALLVSCALLHSFLQSYYIVPFVGIFAHAVNALGFYAAGYIFRKYDMKVNNLLGLLAAVLFFSLFHFGYPVYGLETIGRVHNYAYAYFLAFSGIFFIVSISNLISHNAVLSFLGANSLLVYLLHGYPGAVSSRMFRMLEMVPTSLPSVGFAFLQTMVNLLLLVPVILLILRYMPWTLGRFGSSVR
jgi:fucose 4-O-acetylase-like acetyltransferase